MKGKKISFITTVFNEEKTIISFLNSLTMQTRLLDEIIIVDGGSKDDTLQLISNFKFSIPSKHVKIISKKGNRSTGRNEAIKNATGDIIVCSDAGNILDKDWIKNITEPFRDKKVDVVAGYYKGQAKNIFQKCLIPYVLVMPDQVNPDIFLPATRSMSFTKSIWKKIGGFPEAYSHNEDYVFANRLQDVKAKIVFAKDAIVYWIPRTTFKQAFIMFFRFALGDAEAGILRTRIILLFARYLFCLYFIFLSLLYRSIAPIVIILLFFLIYLVWSVKKNYHYVKHKSSIRLLPALQLTADMAILLGSVVGALKRSAKFNYLAYIRENIFLFFIIGVYIGILLTTLKWGIPNYDHPFPYQMDEWHQLQAVANTFRYGTPNTAGSANGTMFHFILSGFYLIPFIFLKLVNPFSLQLSNFLMRERIFEILRLQTMIFGILSIILMYKIAQNINVSKKLVIVLFTFTPIWLVLSGYFKYDIALIFWILIAILFMFRFIKEPSNKNYLLTVVPIGLAVAVKVSAIPLLPIYLIAYFLFKQKKMWNYRFVLASVASFLVIVLLFGIPDTLFGRGNILYYLYDNILQTPKVTQSFLLGTQPLVYVFIRQLPIIFGYGLFTIFIISFAYWIYKFKNEGIYKFLRKYKFESILIISFIIFLISLMPLQAYAGGNRSLVLLPYLILIIAATYQHLNKFKKIIRVIIGVVLIIQGYQSFSWIYIKEVGDPHVISSEWVKKNITSNQIIGIENIPIYQHLPDIIQKEFYYRQYNIKGDYLYKYKIIDAESNNLPSTIIISNDVIEDKILITSPKNKLRKRLYADGFKKVISFMPNLNYYRFFGNDIDFYIANIVTDPVEISVYKR